MTYKNAFSCFCLEVLTAKGCSETFGQGLLCSHKQNLSGWLGIGS